MAFEIQRQEEGEKSIIAEQKRISRNFVPFVTSPTPGVTFSGVFFTGDRPNWILAGNKSGVQIYPSGHSVVHAFTACSLWDSKGDFLLYTDEVCFVFFCCALHASHIRTRAPLYWNGCQTSNTMALYLLVLSQEDDRTPTFYLILLLP